MSTFLGYAAAAVTTGPLSRRIGFGRTVALAVAIELVGVCPLVNYASPYLDDITAEHYQQLTAKKFRFVVFWILGRRVLILYTSK